MAEDDKTQELSVDVITYLCQFSSCVTCTMCIMMIGYGVSQAPTPTPQVMGGGAFAAMIIFVVCLLSMAFVAPWAAEQAEDKFIQ